MHPSSISGLQTTTAVIFLLSEFCGTLTHSLTRLSDKYSERAHRLNLKGETVDLSASDTYASFEYPPIALIIITVMVDWALKINYLSIYLSIYPSVLRP